MAGKKQAQNTLFLSNYNNLYLYPIFTTFLQLFEKKLKKF